MATHFKNRFLVLSIFIMLIVGFYSCSPNRNTFARRAYHNLTSHYNVFWNGNESLKNALQFVEQNSSDNYNEILPIFQYGTSQQITSINANLDRAQEKASKAIQKHSMRFKGKEYVKWIDDSYLLIGKAYFYKQEYVSARRTFNFIIQEYPENDLRFDAIIWLVKTYNRKGEYEKAENQLLELQSIMDSEIVPYHIKQNVPLMFAELFLMQEKYEIGVDYILQALKLSTSKQLITRLKYILAQIYLKDDRFNEASDLFNEVIRRNPDYQMAFQSKLNLAMSFDGDGDLVEIEKSLNKLLLEAENEDFRDQIYFALAELAIRNQNYQSAIEYFRISVAVSTKNDYQKAKSSLQLADLYFEKKNFFEAGLYYDSCSQFVPQIFPDIEIIKPKLEIMISLVGNLQLVYEQDSLRTIAALSEDERNAIIDGMIEDYNLAELKKQEENQALLDNNSMRLPETNYAANAGGGGSWYFYNPSTLSYGFSQFKSKWGRRKLEDNWRLSRKQMISDDAFAQTDNSELETLTDTTKTKKVVQSNPRNRNYYLQNLPITPEQMKSSDEKIIEAIYSAGMLYKESLKDSLMAFNTFTELMDRYPENPYALQSSYHLYKLSLMMNKIAEANYYKSKILNEFPASNYAKIVADPQYFARMNQQQGEASKYYSDVYNAFKNDQYFLVIDMCDKALANFNDTSLIPKFDYLKTLSKGRIGSVDDLVKDLQRIILAYPSSEIIPMANQVLKSLNTDEDASEIEELDDFNSIYSYSSETFHNYILIVKAGSVNLDALKIRLSDFNRKYSKVKRFAISSFELNDEYQLITVSRFDGASLALDYLKAIDKDQYVLSIFNDEDEYKQFVISNENYMLFYKGKNIDTYIEFYKRFYK